MKARWKWILAVSVIGIACFLSWAVITNPARDLAIQFLGYETNKLNDAAGLPLSNDRGITARFCLTNGSKRTIAYDAFADSPKVWVESKTNGGWTSSLGSFSGGYVGPPNTILSPAHSTRFSVPVRDLSHPLRVTV